MVLDNKQVWVQRETSLAGLFRLVIKSSIFINIRQPARYLEVMEAMAEFQNRRSVTVHRKSWRKY